MHHRPMTPSRLRHFFARPAARNVRTHSHVSRHKARPAIIIQQALTSAEREQLYRFRYRMHSADPERRERYADHDLRRVEDALDATAIHLIAMRGSQIVGAVRINRTDSAELSACADLFRMQQNAGPLHPSRTCLVSRLLVDASLRGGSLGYRLCLSAYLHALNAGIRIAFIDCDDDFIFYFSNLGFKAYVGRIHDQHYGRVLPMKLDLLDEDYLAHIKSPFLVALQRWKQQHNWPRSTLSS